MWTLQETFLAGIAHITEIGAYDHMCYLLAMVAGFTWIDWKKLLALASAFTVGHSITLVLGGLNLVHFPSDWVELGIAATIAVVALFKLTSTLTPPAVGLRDYLINLCFGLIHGMGFSQTIRIMVDENQTSEYVQMLFLFNLGVEVGQVTVLVLLLCAIWALHRFLKTPIRKLQMGSAALALAVGLWLLVERGLGL